MLSRHNGTNVTWGRERQERGRDVRANFDVTKHGLKGTAGRLQRWRSCRHSEECSLAH